MRPLVKLSAACLLLCAPFVAMAQSPAFTEYNVPTSSSVPYYICAGSDGALWFTEFQVGKIGRISTAGVITEYVIPTSSSKPEGIVSGPDGALWFTEFQAGKIGRITTAGSFAEYPITTAASGPEGIAVGPDNALWFTESNTNKIGRITTSGAITEFNIPTPNSNPEGIAAGPDGATWFTEIGGGKIGRITTAGSFTEYPVQTTFAGALAITPGPDGALWFLENNSILASNKVGRITTGGTVTEFPITTTNSVPSGIVTGPDGALWFTEASGNKLGRITISGGITEYSIPTAGGAPGGITVGPDSALWFTEYSSNKIGRAAVLSGAVPIVSGATLPAGQVGSSYSAPLAATGGTAPYNNWTIASGSLPAGLNLSSSTGSIMGTPTAVGTFSFNVTVRDNVGTTSSARVFSITVAPAPFSITTNPTLTGGQVGAFYSQTLSAAGGTPPYQSWTIASGTPPPGLALGASTGSITGTPTSAGTYTFGVTVRDSAGATSPAFSFSISVTMPAPLAITTSSTLPAGSVATPYTQSLGASGGTAPYTWALISGSYPAGLTVSAAGGITGTPTAVGAGNFTMRVTDSASANVSQSFSITVVAGGLTLIGSMPHLAAEGGWNTTFTLVNKTSGGLEAITSLFDVNGNPLALPLTFPPTSNTANAATVDQTIAANASLVIAASGPANVNYVEGSAQLAAAGAVDGFAIFHFDPSQQEAVVPMETRNAASYVLPFDNTNSVLTGIALENVSAQAGSISVVFRNDTGGSTAADTITLAGNGHTSFVLSTKYPSTANIRGTVEFDAPPGGRISALGMRYTPPGTLTTIPSLANVGTTGGTMAHLASGNGWQTTFVLVNTAIAPAQAQLNFYADNGAALLMPLTFLQTGASSMPSSSVTQTIPGGGSLWVQSGGPAGSALLTGSAQLTTTGNIGGSVIFRYNPNGQEAVVPLESRNAAAYLLAFDNTNNTATGVAINAISSQAANVAVVVRDGSGTQLGTGNISLAANGHTSFVMTDQFPSTAGIRGTLEFDAPPSAEISVLGIRSPPALTFTTLPALAK